MLVAGAVLSPGGRTVTQALRVMGLAGKPGFGRYHDVLSRARWDARDVARRLLGHLVAVLSPDGEVIIGIDDTVERRWGPKIAARGIYRDPVRSSKGHFVKTSGLRWLVLAVMLPVPFAGRRWALPFLTVLAPRSAGAGASPAPQDPDRLGASGHPAEQSLAGSRRVTVVADSSFAALDLIAAVRRHVTLITRLRLDANLFEPAPARVPGRRGRPALKGKRVPKLDAVLRDPATVWTKVTLTEWYGGQTCRLEYTSATALWSKAGLPPQPIRWVLVRDPSGTRDAQAFLCTDADLTAEAILTRFVMRWRIETTFQEVRRHLGVETQRQWSDKAILRTTPALLALYSLVTLWAHELHTRAGPIRPQTAAWYDKRLPTFSDALADVRRALWWPQISSTSPPSRDPVKIHPDLLDRWIDTLCRAA